ncbi:MAG: L-threonylcarbamoyladenylate synthase [Bdellovibrionaceae bacterium]|nr:L-threonylcarbamoyladenylate synthase [Pseudobdellovibrionaceae bacterium]
MLQIIKDEDFESARQRLQNDDVVAIPTETVYGLAASIASDQAIRKVFALKKRPFFDPLIVHVASFQQARDVVADWPAVADYLARVFWPGPLTLVLPKRPEVNPLITSGLETVAVRHPRHELTERLIAAVGPLAAPSANRFGRTSPSRAEHVATEFPNEDLLILDGGPCEVGLESTVISFELTDAQDTILILRPGGVTEQDLQQALERWSKPTKIQLGSTGIQAPGQLKHHYMPDIPLVLVGEGGNPASPERLKAIEKTLGLRPQRPTQLTLDTDPAIAAREFYDQLRRLASSGADAILIQKNASRSGGFWDAINDRLGRAASLEIP